MAWAASSGTAQEAPPIRVFEPGAPRRVATEAPPAGVPLDADALEDLARRGWVDLLPDDGIESVWRRYGGDTFPDDGSWTYAGGVLANTDGSKPTDLVTRRPFGNFELRFDYAIGTGANSGVLYRVAELERQPSDASGLEFQLLDDTGHPGAGNTQLCGALYELYEALGKTLKEPGEWNTARIVCFDDRIQHWLNGVKVVDAPLHSAEWYAKVSQTRFADFPQFGTNPQGFMCLQGLGQQVWFRRLFIRELPPPRSFWQKPEQPLADASLQTLVPRVPGRVDPRTVWSLDASGVLHCSGRTRAAYLHTRGRYDSFLLSLDWRFPTVDTAQARGRTPKARVLLRVRGRHRIWPESDAILLEPGRAGDFVAASETFEAYTKDGTVAPRRRDGERKPTEWNNLQVLANGGWVQVVINGQVVNEVWGLNVEPGELAVTCEGWPVDVRNMVITPVRPHAEPTPR